MLRELLTRLRFLVIREPLTIDEELAFHLELQIAANVAAGMSAVEARRLALIAFGGIERTRGECVERRPGFWFETFLQDIRYALRGFRRNAPFFFTIVATLMLGIGATTAVFSVVDRILFRSLPYADADRLVSVGLLAPIQTKEFMLGGSYYEWRDHQTPFEVLTSEVGVNPCDLTDERPSRLSCASVEATFLPTFGIRPLLGRNFTAEEDRSDAPKVALISYALWRTRFHGDPGVLNKLLILDDRPTRIVGVLPKSFEMPTLEETDVVVPQALDEAAQRRAMPGRVMYGFARLKQGVSIEQAKAALQPVFDYSLRLAPAPFRKEVHLQVRSLRDLQVHDVRLIAWILFGLAAALLLISCANVSSLLLARGAGRERELAVRSALGASRSRLMRQTLTESVVLSVAGAIAGYVLAEILLRVFVAIAPGGMPFLDKAQIDFRIILVTLGLSCMCGILFGLFPALHTPKAEALAGRRLPNASQGTLRQWLVVVQIAASMILLAAGGLLFRSYLNLQNERLGMDTNRIVTASLSLGQKDYPTAESQMAFFEELERRLRYSPGVKLLALSDSLPPGGFHHDEIFARIVVAGRQGKLEGTGGLVTWRWVSPEYFRALDIPMLQGDGFREQDLTSPGHFLILSRSLASRLFKGEDPIGQSLQLQGGTAGDPVYMVMGVAADVKNAGLTGADQPEYYRLRRSVAEDWDRRSVLVIKSSLTTEAMQRTIRSEVASLDPALPVDIEIMSESVSRLADQPRFEAALVGFFAVTGLVLALVGLYGVNAFLVAQQTQEIGVRMALGATRGSILKLVLGRSLRLIGLGASLGLLAALATTRFLSSMLFDIGPHDPATFALVVFGLGGIALLATLIPARSAMNVDPMVSLRCD